MGLAAGELHHLHLQLNADTDQSKIICGFIVEALHSYYFFSVITETGVYLVHLAYLDEHYATFVAPYCKQLILTVIFVQLE